MTATGKTITLTASEPMCLKTKESTLASGKTTLCMVMEFRPGLMANATKDNSTRAKSMDKAKLPGQTENIMMEIGLMVCKKAMVLFSI